MTIIMDRISDLNAVNWKELSPGMMDAWEQEALMHDQRCRCAKCALFFARLSKDVIVGENACAIRDEVIAALREILRCCDKL